MGTLVNSHIPAPKGAQEFEQLIGDYANIRWSPAHFSLFGRNGQKQDGVDVYGNVQGVGLIAYQCKNTISGVTDNVIADEATNATKNPLGVTRLFIATTAPRDVKSQVYAYCLNTGPSPLVTFPVDIIFWDDIINVISQNHHIFKKHFPQFNISTQPITDHDGDLLNAIINLFSNSGTIKFLSQNHMGSGIEGHETNNISDFYENWNGIEKTFMDQNLESIRINLHNSCRDYLIYLAQNFHRNNGRLSATHLREDNPIQYETIISTLHNLGDNIVSTYNSLVISGRR